MSNHDYLREIEVTEMLEERILRHITNTIVPLQERIKFLENEVRDLRTEVETLKDGYDGNQEKIE